MNVLLTGPFGTIGTRVLEELLRRKHVVTCFDLDNKTNRKIASGFGERIRMVWGDITDAVSVGEAVKSQDAVIHLAALIPPVSEQKPALAEKINVGGTRLILDAIAAQANMPLLVFPSSISVHGFSNTRQPPCRIDTPFQACDNYAGQKIECEKLLRQSIVPWVMFRIGACADALNMKSGDSGAMLRQSFMVDPATRVEYLHPKDAAIAMANALEHKEVVGKVLFLGSGKNSQVTWIDFINIVPTAMGIGELPREAFGKDPYYTDWMDTEETQRLLQFQQYGLDVYKQEIREKFRYLRCILWPVRKLVRKYLLGFSQINVG
ncbi:MAG TPA: NAD(P)-dependent oxidoreductase [Pseudomonadales bacterium]|nr:NAD(P)-dependent oxidoreductase [Pseudomonadales bacterium]